MHSYRMLLFVRDVRIESPSSIYIYIYIHVVSLFHKQEQMDVFGSEAFKFELVQKLGKVHICEISTSLSQ